MIDDKIDPYILPLLKHLWKNKITTYFSCSSHPPKEKNAYITFKYNKKLISYLYDNGFRCWGHWNAIDKYGQWCVETKTKKERDKLFTVLSHYK